MFCSAPNGFIFNGFGPIAVGLDLAVTLLFIACTFTLFLCVHGVFVLL